MLDGVLCWAGLCVRQRPAEGNEVDRPPWRSGMEESAFQRRSSTSRSPTLHLCLHDALNVLLKFEPELLMISCSVSTLCGAVACLTCDPSSIPGPKAGGCVPPEGPTGWRHPTHHNRQESPHGQRRGHHCPHWRSSLCHVRLCHDTSWHSGISIS